MPAFVYLFAGLQASSADCLPAPAGLVSWWPGEGDAKDVAGGNDGALYNGVGFVPGMVGRAFTFNGTNSYLEVPDSPALRLGNELTIEFWVKRQRFNGIEVIIEKGGDWTGTECNYEVDLHDSRQNYCLYLLYNGGLQGGGQIADDKWHHCGVTARNGSTEVGIYVDGVRQPVSYIEGSSIVALTPSARPLHIGAQLDPVTGWYYYGATYVDEMSLYDRVLSATEIQAIYNAGIAGKCRPAPLPHAATATATVVNGFVVSATIVEGGYGYTNTPGVRIIGGGGSGAQAVATVANGVVTALNILNAGYGYTSTPAIVIDPPFIPPPTMAIGALSLLSFTNLTVGTNYQLQFFGGNTWSNLGAAFTAASSTFTQYVSGGADPSGYRLASTPISTQAYARALVVNGFVVGATVISGGSGYGSNVAVSIVGGGGSNATVVATVSEGVVIKLTITNAGIGYTKIPTVVITPPPVNGLRPTVTGAMEVDLGNLAPYDNYRLEFTPVLGEAWSPLDSPFTPTSTTYFNRIPVSNSAGFFRAVHTPR